MARQYIPGEDLWLHEDLPWERSIAHSSDCIKGEDGEVINNIEKIEMVIDCDNHFLLVTAIVPNVLYGLKSVTHRSSFFKQGKQRDSCAT